MVIRPSGSLAGDHGRDCVDGAPSLWPGCACPRQHGRCGPAAGLLQVVLQLARTARVAQLPERLRLDLADPLAAQVEVRADLVKGAGAPVLEAEAELEDSALTAGQRVEHGRHLLLEELVRRRLGRGQRAPVLDEVAQVRVPFLADRGLERDRFWEALMISRTLSGVTTTSWPFDIASAVSYTHLTLPTNRE